jgi:hypothetical protein
MHLPTDPLINPPTKRRYLRRNWNLKKNLETEIQRMKQALDKILL